MSNAGWRGMFWHSLMIVSRLEPIKDPLISTLF